MEWYRNDRVDDIVVPSDQSARSSFPSQKRWKGCGLNAMNSVDLLDNSYAIGNCGADEGDFSCETFVDVDQLEMDSLVGEGNQAEISGVRGGISESSNCWTALLNNQDYELDGFPWTNQTDENFLNSLLVDDMRANDQFHIYGSPKSQGIYSTTNSLTTDMLLDSRDMGSYEQKDSPSFPFTLDWESHHNLQNMMITSAQCNTPHENFPQQVCAGRVVSDNPSVEETVLQEIGSTVQKMTHKTRLCFRDALYRLATNSQKQSSVLQGEHVASEKAFKITLPDHTLRFMEKDATEPRTNTIDSTIADLLFNKPYPHGDCHQDLSSAAKPHTRYPPMQSQLTLQPAFIRGR